MKRSKLEPRGQRPLQHEHIPLLALNLNSNKNNGTPNGKKGTRLPKEKHDLNKGGPMVKQLLRLVHATNALPKVLPNHPKETSLTNPSFFMPIHPPSSMQKETSLSEE
jgi:hypothetical protein